MTLPPLDLAALVLAAADPAREEAYRRGFSLTLMVAILGILLIMMLSVIVALRRSRRRREQASPKVPSIEHIDAWSESGRRFDGSITHFDND